MDPSIDKPNPLEYWDGRYRDQVQLWSGSPNQGLVSSVGRLPPGRALDLGCGEGADAVWLAERGWQITAVDISPTAVSRGREAAEETGIPDGRIEWVAADLARWKPTAHFDLVISCFMHSPLEFERTAVLRRAAGQVLPGGHLLIVGHAGPPPWHQGTDRVFLRPDEELAELSLDPDSWTVRRAEVTTRKATGPDGETAQLEDGVVLLERRAPATPSS